MRRFGVAGLGLAIAALVWVIAAGAWAAKEGSSGQPFQRIDEQLDEIQQATEETADDVGEILQFWAPGKLDWIYYATRGTASVDVEVDAGPASDLNRSPVVVDVLVQTQGRGVAGLSLPAELGYQNGVAPDMSIATVISAASDFPTAPGLYRLELTPLGGNWRAGKYVGVLKVEYEENLVDAPPGPTRGSALVSFEIRSDIN